MNSQKWAEPCAPMQPITPPILERLAILERNFHDLANELGKLNDKVNELKNLIG